ncbi:putative iron-regulated membrane protein [Marinibacterium anthonyi]|nr:putative iron-regulated membrane protein [Marinibacterium anthonyi]
MTHTHTRAAGAALYRAIWRWHFIAGLVVLPFVLILAVTGGIYLFKDEINDTAYSRLRFVQADGAALLPSQITEAALQAHPGTLKAYTPPGAPNRSAEVDILGDDGLRDTVYVDPLPALCWARCGMAARRAAPRCTWCASCIRWNMSAGSATA